MSSIFALGPTDGDIADENQIHREKIFSTGYEKLKVASDKIAVQAPSEGVPIVLLLSWSNLWACRPGKATAGNVVARVLGQPVNSIPLWVIEAYGWVLATIIRLLVLDGAKKQTPYQET
ncbi:hypothetical protein SESBI_35603 [Sesbania bispinosa]|nr:hypothetical protein SESBI_35603 [Sesbania bispinosa]